MELGVAQPTSGALTSPAGITRIAQKAEQLSCDAPWHRCHPRTAFATFFHTLGRKR